MPQSQRDGEVVYDAACYHFHQRGYLGRWPKSSMAAEAYDRAAVNLNVRFADSLFNATGNLWNLV